LLVFATLVAAAVIAQEEPRYAIWGDPKVGREVYAEKHCGKCHAINGVGPRIGPDLARAREPQTITQIAAAMWNHAPEMRRQAERLGVRWQPFQGSEMRDLIAFLYFLRMQDRPGDPRRGERLFDEKRCSTCHALAGSGSKIGPDLTELSYGSSVLWAEVMWRHALEMERKMRELGLSWPTFTDNEMEDLITFIQSQKKGDSGDSEPEATRQGTP
jgi:mono/diheme cytochrome c family protein